MSTLWAVIPAVDSFPCRPLNWRCRPICLSNSDRNDVPSEKVKRKRSVSSSPSAVMRQSDNRQFCVKWKRQFDPNAAPTIGPAHPFRGGLLTEDFLLAVQLTTNAPMPVLQGSRPPSKACLPGLRWILDVRLGPSYVRYL